MEWTPKTPFQWDLENLMAFNAPPVENPRNVQAACWEFDGHRGNDLGFYLFENGSASGCGSGPLGSSSSDLGLASFSKSSNSASINSSSTGEVKTSKAEEFASTKPSDASPALEASAGSGEPLLGLKLGKRTYFEDFCAGSNSKTSPMSGPPVSSVAPAKRTRSSSLVAQVPRCQVEGCNINLESAKDYHRKHRVCECHTKTLKVIVAGQERRFCQQCSRFHGLSEFDEKKRSCRRRLLDHNARRRKPPPNSAQFNPLRPPSLLYDDRKDRSEVWNGAMFFNSRSNASIAWDEFPSNDKFTITKECIVKPAKKGGGVDVRNNNDLSNSIPANHSDFYGLFSSKTKGTRTEVLDSGLQETPIIYSVDASQDLHRALSLLSTDSWGSSYPTKSVSPAQIQHPNNDQTSLPPPMLNISSTLPCYQQPQPSETQICGLPSHGGASGSYFPGSSC